MLADRFLIIYLQRRICQFYHFSNHIVYNILVFQIAGIMGSKKTPELIPLCHPISLTKVDLRVRLDTGTTDCVTTECEAKCLGQVSPLKQSYHDCSFLLSLVF